MLAVTQVAKPGLEGRGIVFLYGLAVGEDGGFAGDGRPFTSGIEEGDVDCRVGGYVVGLAGFGVGMEYQVDASSFLGGKIKVSGI